MRRIPPTPAARRLRGHSLGEANGQSPHPVLDREQVRVFQGPRRLPPAPAHGTATVQVRDRRRLARCLPPLRSEGSPDGSRERVPELPEPLSPPIDGFGIGEELRCPPLVVRGDVVQHPLQIAPVPRLIRPSHQLNVSCHIARSASRLWKHGVFGGRGTQSAGKAPYQRSAFLSFCRRAKQGTPAARASSSRRGSLCFSRALRSAARNEGEPGASPKKPGPAARPCRLTEPNPGVGSRHHLEAGAQH